MRKFVFAIAGSSLLLLTAGGCGYEESSCAGADCKEPTSAVSEPAFAVGGFVPWTLSNGQLRLCFSRDASLNTTEFVAIRDHALATLNGTWGNIPGLDFVSGCTSPAMGITLLKGDGSSGVCGLGNGASCKIWGDPVNVANNDGTTVHEVGHGLGLLHEHQRPDAGPLCPFEQNILNGCTPCATGTCSASEANACWFAAPAASSITVSAADRATATSLLAGGKTACQPCSTGTCPIGSCSGGTCTPAASYWGCFGVNPTTGTINVSSGDQGSAQGRVNDRTVDTAGSLLTKYDPRSIMSYCAAVNGRSDNNPTDYDLLGMEMLYSTNHSYRLGCGATGCLATASGVVASTSGSVVSEWIARGSLGVPFRVSGSSTDVYSYSVSPLVGGVSTLNYTFKDKVGNARSGSGSVNKSNPAYTALLRAASEIL